MSARPRRIAIVGSGISGLVCAHHLHSAHDITLFEAADWVGGHTHTLDVETASGRWTVDTGFIVYNEPNYPEFTRLLARLGVATQPTTMSFSVRSERTGLEYNGSSLSHLFSQRRNLARPSFHRMLLDIARFSRRAPADLARAADDLTIGEYVAREAYATEFVEHYLVPIGASIWSQPPGRLLDMPATFFVRFLDNHGMLSLGSRPQWRTVSGGAARYVEALVRGFRDRIRLRHPVRRVARQADHVLVDGERFDEVVLACHADQALSLLAEATPAEREILGALPYQTNTVLVHTDISVLPRRRRAWGGWNYHIRRDADPAAPAAITYNMNALQSLDAPETFCVTLNHEDAVDPARVLARLTYHHPLYTHAGTAAQRRWAEISGPARTHYCGAYWGNGFHEDGVRSALAVCRRLAAA